MVMIYSFSYMLYKVEMILCLGQVSFMAGTFLWFWWIFHSVFICTTFLLVFSGIFQLDAFVGVFMVCTVFLSVLFFNPSFVFFWTSVSTPCGLKKMIKNKVILLFYLELFHFYTEQTSWPHQNNCWHYFFSRRLMCPNQDRTVGMNVEYAQQRLHTTRTWFNTTTCSTRTSVTAVQSAKLVSAGEASWSTT